MAEQRRSPIRAVLRGFVTTLRASTEVTGRVEGVYNNVPQGTGYPYIEVSAPTSRRVDTWGILGSEALIDVKVVSQYRGDDEADEIMDYCIRALDLKEPVLTDGHRMLGIAWDSGERFKETVNGVATRYHVGTFRAWSEQTTS